MLFSLCISVSLSLSLSLSLSASVSVSVPVPASQPHLKGVVVLAGATVTPGSLLLARWSLSPVIGDDGTLGGNVDVKVGSRTCDQDL